MQKKKIEIEVKEIEKKLKKYFSEKLKIVFDFQELLKEANKLYDFAANVKLDDNNLTDQQEFLQKVNKGFENLDIGIEPNTLAITKLGDYWQVLKILSNDTSVINDPLFARLWTNIFEVTQHQKKWLGFVESVYHKLSDYDTQKDRSKPI